jgi:signal transduction histidine kinase/DNA-binding response OmpR family regulator
MPPERAKILLVDDRRANLLAVEQLLSSPDYEIIQAASGREALAFLLKAECAVILMDVNMPEMDGYETARLIRQNERTRDIPIVFVTAMALDERNVLAGYESGAIDYLMKPLRPEVLRSKVAGFVNLHRARLELKRQAELLREHERREHAHALAALELKTLQHQQAAQRRYRTLVEGLTRAVVWVLDPTTLVPKLVSPSAEPLLGLAPEWWSSSPRTWSDCLPPADLERFLEIVRGLRSGGPSATLEHRIVGAGGRILWFETTVRLITGEDPRSAELHALSTDVTDAVEARESGAFLARASAQLSSSLDPGSTLEAAVRLALERLSDWCVIEVGDAGVDARSLAGHGEATEDAAAREAAAHLSLPFVRAAAAVAPIRARDAFGAGAASLVERLGGAGLLVPLAVQGARVGTLCLFGRHPHRFAPRTVALAEELGRRVAQGIENAQLHEQTRAAVRAREQLLSVASHELRTPISSLSLQARLIHQIVQKMDLPAASRDDLDRRFASVLRQVSRLGSLLNTLLDLARIRNTRLQLELERCDLAEVLRDVGSRFEDALRAEGRILTLALPERLVGRWDRTRVDQLVTNLVANAVKHGGKGAITIGAAIRDGSAVLTVSDTGPGIPVADQARIFEAFAQGREAANGGLGLGLYITRSIVEAHGGALALESSPGRGATFRVELPLDGPAGASVEAPQARAAGDTGEARPPSGQPDGPMTAHG